MLDYNSKIINFITVCVVIYLIYAKYSESRTFSALDEVSIEQSKEALARLDREAAAGKFGGVQQIGSYFIRRKLEKRIAAAEAEASKQKEAEVKAEAAKVKKEKGVATVVADDTAKKAAPSAVSPATPAPSSAAAPASPPATPSNR